MRQILLLVRNNGSTSHFHSTTYIFSTFTKSAEGRYKNILNVSRLQETTQGSIPYILNKIILSFPDHTILEVINCTSNDDFPSGLQNVVKCCHFVIHLWIQGQLLCQRNQHFDYSNAAALALPPGQIETNLYLHLCICQTVLSLNCRQKLTSIYRHKAS